VKPFGVQWSVIGKKTRASMESRSHENWLTNMNNKMNDFHIRLTQLQGTHCAVSDSTFAESSFEEKKHQLISKFVDVITSGMTKSFVDSPVTFTEAYSEQLQHQLLSKVLGMITLYHSCLDTASYFEHQKHRILSTSILSSTAPPAEIDRPSMYSDADLLGTILDVIQRLTRFRHTGLNKVIDLVKLNQIQLGHCANLSVIVDLN
jgi:hypothetical protein